MSKNRHRLDRGAGSGWFVSSLVHLGLVYLLLRLTVLPRAEPQAPLELETRLRVPNAALVVLDTTLADPDPDNHARVVDLIGDSSAAPKLLTISSGDLAAGDGHIGRQESTAGTKKEASGGVGRTSFFGTEAFGNRFVYILDTSGSMNAGHGRRLNRAITELLRSIDELREDQSFYVLLFSSRTRKMFDSRDRHPALLPATAEDKNRLRSWLADLRPSGGTDPYEALRVGIKLQPSAIFLLSDGRFTGSRRQRRVIPGSSKRETIIRREDPAIRDLAGLVGNPDRIPIHTVAFEELKAQENLKELSQLSSGQFRFVRAPLGIPEHMNADARERTAAHWMAVANELEAQSRPDMAQLYYQKILDNFASTRAAREAGRRRKRVVLSSHPTWVGSDRDKPKDLAATGRSTVSPQD